MNAFDMAEGLYFYLTDYHSGQGSESYKVLCELQEIYSPGQFYNHPEAEEASEIYEQLVRKIRDPRDLLEELKGTVE